MGIPAARARAYQEQRLVLAVPVALLQDNARLVVLRAGALRVGVVFDLVSYEVIEGNSLLPIYVQPPGQLRGFVFDRFRVPVDNRRGPQILI